MNSPAPSIRSLAAVFDNPREAKRIFRMTRDGLLATEAGAARARECFSRPKTYDIRMTVLDSINPATFGVEAVEMANGEYADYLNVGETYAPTVIYWRGRYRVQSVGDFVETMERRHCRAK